MIVGKKSNGYPNVFEGYTFNEAFLYCMNQAGQKSKMAPHKQEYNKAPYIVY